MLRPRLATLALVLSLAGVVAAAAWIRAFPERAEANTWVCQETACTSTEPAACTPRVVCAPRRPVLGVETLVLPGATAIRWRGPYDRSATIAGDGRFPVHGMALWSDPTSVVADGASAADARFEVDHRLTGGEAVGAALAAWPMAWSLTLVFVVVAILRDGAPMHAAFLALCLASVRAFSPAWNLDSDPARYWASAQALLDGRAPDTLWPPGWPFALVPAAAMGGPLLGRMTGVVLYALCPLLAARVVRSPGAPLAAALVTALSAELCGFAPSLYADTLFVFLGLTFFCVRTPVGAGVIAAMAALTRAHGLLVLPLVWLVRRGRVEALFGGALLVPVLLWSVVPSLQLARPVLISDNAGMNLWIGHRPGADGDWHDPGPAPAPGYGPAALAEIRADPVAAGSRVLKNVERLWNASLSDRTLATRPLPLPLLPFPLLVAMAAVGAWRTRRRDLLIWLAATTFLTALFFAPVRYKLGLYPALLPLAGEGVAWIGVGLARWIRAGMARDS